MAKHTIEGLEDLVHSVRAIASGGVSGPDGLEAVAMAIAGNGFVGTSGLAGAIENAGSEIASAINRLAAAIEGLQR